MTTTTNSGIVNSGVGSGGGGSSGVGSSASPGSSLTRRDVTCLWAVQLVLRVALGGLFVFAAYHKLKPPASEGALSGPQSFASSVLAFKIGLPDVLVRAAVACTPWIELVAGLALIFGVWRRAAAAIIGALLVLFIGLIISVLVRKLPVDCGCFGDLSPFCDKAISECNIVQNAVLLAIAAYLTFWPVARMRRA